MLLALRASKNCHPKQPQVSEKIKNVHHLAISYYFKKRQNSARCYPKKVIAEPKWKYGASRTPLKSIGPGHKTYNQRYR